MSSAAPFPPAGFVEIGDGGLLSTFACAAGAVGCDEPDAAGTAGSEPRPGGGGGAARIDLDGGAGGAEGTRGADCAGAADGVRVEGGGGGGAP
jgi:hypothetical protein